eukprot:3669596-Pleurochrysis_carterae.AAC.1
MIFDALNMSDYDIKRSNVTSVEGWVPIDSLAELTSSLAESERAKGRNPPLINEISTRLTPPTYIPVTSFTSGFQASGCARCLSTQSRSLWHGRFSAALRLATAQ